MGAFRGVIMGYKVDTEYLVDILVGYCIEIFEIQKWPAYEGVERCFIKEHLTTAMELKGRDGVFFWGQPEVLMVVEDGFLELESGRHGSYYNCIWKIDEKFDYKIIYHILKDIKWRHRS